MTDTSPLPQRFDDAIAAWQAAPARFQQNVAASLASYGNMSQQSSTLQKCFRYASTVMSLVSNKRSCDANTLGLLLQYDSLNKPISVTLGGKCVVMPAVQAVVATLLMDPQDGQVRRADQLGPGAPLATPHDYASADLLACQLLTVFAMAELVVKNTTRAE